MTKFLPVFPEGAPGVALVLMRIATALLPLVELDLKILPVPWFGSVALILSACLVGGLLTRLVAAFYTGLAVATAIGAGGALALLLAIQALQTIALAFLGAGAYSIDARLFGRRVIRLSGGRGPSLPD